MFELWIFAGMFVFDVLLVGVLVVASLVQEHRHRPPTPARAAAVILPDRPIRMGTPVVTYNPASGVTEEQAVAIIEKAWPGSRIVDTDRDTLQLRDANRRAANWN